MLKNLPSAFGFAALAACASSGNPTLASSTEPARPTLVVMLTIDQFRGDYIQRFRPQLTGGLARFADGGAWFTNAHQDHGITETAPGHASLLSGRFPRSTGISNNRAGVEDRSFPLIEFYPGEIGASPNRFRGTGLFDWMYAADSRARALSISMKDRAAILPIGKAKQNVYWYSTSGKFTTSTYYASKLPDWLQAFNARDLGRRSAGKTWALLLPESAYPEPDSIPAEASGTDFVFPHVITSDSTNAASTVRLTPFMDDMTLAAALAGVNALQIGKGPHVDLLNISLSATDIIGHRYGPDSREMHDQMLRVDRAIGAFIDSLYKLRDSSRIVFAISGDHGVASLPELNVERASPPPVRVSLGGVVANARVFLREAGVDTTAIVFDGLTVIAEREKFRTAKQTDSILDMIASDYRAVAGVARVDRFSDLLKGDTVGDPIARRWSHQFRPGDIDLAITLTRMSIASSNSATHGSPYDYDTHVPIIFYGAGILPGVYSSFVRTVDIGPTLAVLLGIKALEKLDGVPLLPR
ncbi:MAG: alkaline phosphatase family protein [Gemmatimonadaceae bacterium]|nr:alkaline phosphatase family protein [Gemmatimonadaceae bacterium]